MDYRHRIFVKMRSVYLPFIPLGFFMLPQGGQTFGTTIIMFGTILFLRTYFWQ